MRYTYLGPEGTFTEEALNQILDPADVAEPSTDVPGALTAVREGRFDRAVVPIENSVEGGVNATIDSLVAGEEPLVVVAEMLVPIQFDLIAREGTELADVRRIATHPHAWAQCRGWVAEHLPGAVHVPATSTAAAAGMLADEGEPGFDAGIVSPLAGRRYEVPVLAHDVGDNRQAVTRFIAVSRLVAPPPPTGADKTTLLVHLPDDEAGALLTMLEQFAARGVNLSRIESRPIRDAIGRYAFSIDAEGHVTDERVKAALLGLRRVCPVVRFLGSYPRADQRRPVLARGTSDQEFHEARAWVSALADGTAF
ncbi:prephenate dehydratase [Georgenia sp. Z1491]|uniref:prephenate dehydratase n=1 Tax=Georgenia sp. Z1491 TaxID=3416707 RepID=UPI003CEB0992